MSTSLPESSAPHPSVVVSLILPACEQAAEVVEAVRTATRVLAAGFAFYEILIVDDGSQDDTAQRVQALLAEVDRVRYLRLTRRHGREVAVAAGLEACLGDFVVIAVPGQDPLEEIPDLVHRCRRGSGVLCGVAEQAGNRSVLSKWSAGVFRRYCRRQLGLDYRENATDFRVLSRQAVNAITRFRDRHRHLKIFTAIMGFPVEYFSYTPRRSLPLETWRERVDRAIETAIANSRHPLRVVSRVGLALSGVNVLYAGYIVAIYFFKEDVAEGWTTTSLQNTGMFFFLFLILAVLCEYVGRILEEVQDRPLYFLAGEKTSSVLLESSIERNILHRAEPSWEAGAKEGGE